MIYNYLVFEWKFKKISLEFIENFQKLSEIM